MVPQSYRDAGALKEPCLLTAKSRAPTLYFKRPLEHRKVADGDFGDYVQRLHPPHAARRRDSCKSHRRLGRIRTSVLWRT